MFNFRIKKLKDDHRFDSNSGHISNLSQQISTYMANRPGGNKRKQIYRKKQSPYLKSLQLVTTQTQSYLYMIKCELTTSIQKEGDPSPIGTPEEIPGSKDTRCFGILTSKLLLEICDFPIFTQNGEETVSVELIRSGLFLTPNQLKLVKSFHRFLFSNVLRMDGRGATASAHLQNSNIKVNGIPSDPTGCFVCILAPQTADNTKFDFDWELMKQVEGVYLIFTIFHKMNPFLVRKHFVFLEFLGIF
jgi:hypothetical protein